jgi:hypothetical protein
MAVSKGLALVYGAKGTITLYTPAGVALTTGAISTIESYDATHEADVEQIKNSAGEVVAQVSANERISLNVTFIPSAASFAQAKLAAGLPAVNGYATIAASDGVTIGSGASNSLDGNYVYAGGGSVKFTSSGKVMVTVTVTKYLDASALTGSASTFTL